MRGINAINIKNVKGESGHEAQSNMPDKKLKPNDLYFFKQLFFWGERSEIFRLHKGKR